MEVQELQVLRTVFAFSHQRCSLEGMHFYFPLFAFPHLVFQHSTLTPCVSSVRSGSWTGGDGAWVELSGKMHVLARLLAHLRKRTDDRIVLVSNYTQVLLYTYSRLHIYAHVCTCIIAFSPF